ncbi:putative membrane protein [Chromobacterium alkanivorans]|uniref:multidrug/biocide efflux PACE transporter n=1 Tax=Chromobacterium TaxID=535 RepID=UPI0006539314|nr:MULTISPECIES: multidrug/biocide efflux PACE transporter [Chromobacterium]KMN81229.1 membrane protein [Chromobacterium sp. LK11]MBN3004147.1 multidrug/biocide efflux PACE transporter [Chromobacterium alkanivorans]MCS3806610.1 putative membrane protein [Chromobacterium alkanivorans]MCS3820948.1 putative membrane protein [Chromobacterium alkanivorans]MCS3875870.1 putative membrane protein [Chromobacterium alkanivorans]
MQVKKSWPERAFYAIVYELCAVMLLMLMASWLLSQDTAQIGVLALMMTTVAMSWNIVFNALFERLERLRGWVRTPALRVAHALLFEGGLVVLLVPLVAWWLEVSYWQAFLLDIGFFLFFLPYTFVFNWLYDGLRASLLNRLNRARAGLI